MKKQSIIMPYHSNKQMLKYTTELLLNNIDENVEIIVVGNNDNDDELNVELSSRINYIKVNESLLYSNTVNMGVELAKGDIITLCDQDVFSYSNWYTPLLNKLTSNREIGAVSSKLLNPTNKRIIDFGIEYSNLRITHTYRGHKYNYPLSMVDRKVTSSTSAILMTYKSLYNDVGGMDIDMPYCCSDCDIGLKISDAGYENWVVADSIAFHRGSSSMLNGKRQSFEFLRNESNTMFWVKNMQRLKPTVQDDIERAANYIMQCHKPLSIYTFINLSTLSEYKWYCSILESCLKTKISDIHSYKVLTADYASPIQIYDSIPFYFMNYTTPLIYFVDYFPSLKDNIIWNEMRNTENDLIFDSHGNIVKFKDLIDDLC